MSSFHYNPERRAWRGRSYKRGGEYVTALRRHDAERELLRARSWDGMGFDSPRSTGGRAGATATATAGSTPVGSTEEVQRV